MAEEEKDKGLQAEEGNTGEADSQTDGTPSKDDAATKDDGQAKVDYERRYKDLQEEYRRSQETVKETERRLERLEQPPEPDEDLDADDEGFVDRKAVNKIVDAAVSKAVSQVRMQSANTYFRKTYPDLVKHENAIAGIMRSPKDPSKLKGASGEERIDAAVKEFNDLTEEAKATAKAEAEAEAKEREDKNRQAAGLTSSSTTPVKSGEEELSDADELKARKSSQAKKRGLV